MTPPAAHALDAVAEPMSYIGRCGACDRIVMAIVDTPEIKRDVAKAVAQGIREGLRIERVTRQAVRDSAKAKEWGCTSDCPCKWCVKKRQKAATRREQLEFDR